LILEFGGSIHDAVSMAVKAALHDTRIPQLIVGRDEDGEPTIDCYDDPYKQDRVAIDNVPCFVTLSRIRDKFVLDASPEELECSLGNMVIGVTPQGKVAATVKTGTGSLHPDNVQQALQLAQQVGKNLHRALDKKLIMAEKEGGESNSFLIN